jgi:hypothetical protein
MKPRSHQAGATAGGQLQRVILPQDSTPHCVKPNLGHYLALINFCGLLTCGSRDIDHFGPAHYELELMPPRRSVSPGEHLPDDPRVRASSPRRVLARLRLRQMRSERQ